MYNVIIVLLVGFGKIHKGKRGGGAALSEQIRLDAIVEHSVAFYFAFLRPSSS